MFGSEGLESARLIDVRKIWDLAPHNAMTDLARFGSDWLCVFREGGAHVSPDGKIRILLSQDGSAWNSVALISMPGADLRDPKLSITPSGCLMLNAAAAYSPPAPQRHQSFAWFSSNAADWGDSVAVGEPNSWLWRATWKENQCFAVGYRTVEPLGTRLYCSPDGARYEILVPEFFKDEFPNEATLLFRTDGTALCLLRRDAGSASAMLGEARGDFLHWGWKDLGVRIGGPNLIELPDGRIVAAFRRYGRQPWTSLSRLDPVEGRLTELLNLPSGGDTSYPGLVWHDGLLWISYYSSHEGRTCIYLARAAL